MDHKLLLLIASIFMTKSMSVADILVEDLTGVGKTQAATVVSNETADDPTIKIVIISCGGVAAVILLVCIIVTSWFFYKPQNHKNDKTKADTEISASQSCVSQLKNEPQYAKTDMPENDWNKPVGYYDRKASPANLKSKSKKRQQDYDKLTEVVVIPYQNAKEKTVKTEAPTEPEKVAIPQIPSESQLNRSVNLSAGPNCLSLSETLMEIPTSAASVGLQDKVSRMIPPSSTITERSISAWLDRSYPGAVDAELPEVVHLDEIELASTMYESAREYCSIASERSAEIAVTQGENKLTEPINCEKSSIPVLQVVPSEKAMITPISVSSFSLLSAMDSAESLTSQGNSVCNSCDNSSDISESDGEDEHQGVKEVLWASNPQRSFLYVSDGRQQMTFMQKLCVVP